MPNFKTAKEIAENALRTIGAFPVSQSQADESELRTTLEWLEMLLNTVSGYRPLAGFWRIIDIPIEAGIGDYILTDYADAKEVQDVFSICLVDSLGNVDPIDVEWENDTVLENLNDVGKPRRGTITKDARQPVLRVFPTPTQTEEDLGLVLRLRIQTYHPAFDANGIGDTKIIIRPSWYLWLTKRLSYEIGSGPVRRLPEGELKRFENDYERLESLLIARDGQYKSDKPPVTEPMAGS